MSRRPDVAIAAPRSEKLDMEGEGVMEPALSSHRRTSATMSPLMTPELRLVSGMPDAAGSNEFADPFTLSGAASGAGEAAGFLRRGKRKMVVVVVDTVCVVVVVLNAIRSPKLPSDLDDSESLVSGMASDELDSSP